MSPQLTLTIEKPVAGGRMLARHDGRVVLVSGAIPGERVTVRVEKATRQVMFAVVVDVLEPSPSRRAPVCDPACGGSDYAHITIERQRELKGEIVADAFRRVGKLPLDQPVAVAASSETGYRLRGRLHVQDRRAGFFIERSHRLCDAGTTRQFLPETVPAVARLLKAAGAAAEQCAAVLVTENVAGLERVCHLEGHDGKDLDPSPGAWSLVDGLTGVTTRAGERLITLAGAGRVTDTGPELCGDGDDTLREVSWTRTAASFFQGNRYLTGTLLQRVLNSGDVGRVLDLYAGVGLFSIGFAARGAVVTAVEGDPTSVADLEINAERYADALTIRQASVESVVATLAPATFDTVVLDPPRTGATPDALAGIAALRAPRVLYVSCDPATLARDAGYLVKQGYRLISVESFDLFPNTAHVETLAIFERG